LAQTSTLVIWTAPPSQSVLDEVIQRTKPKRILVFGLQPAITTMKAFLERLGGLIKFAIKHKNGKTTLDALASACAVTKTSIRLGLNFWETLGNLQVEYKEDEVILSLVDKFPNSGLKETYQLLLQASLEESQTYRRYFQKGDLRNFMPSGKRT
jgi:hypothetical protein